MRVGLHQLAQSAATDAQIPAWDDAAGLWVPVDPPSGGGLPTGGSTGQVLTKLSGTDFDADWQDPTGGGGDAFTLDNLLPSYLQSANLDATYGDDFTGTSIDAKWTRHTVSSGDETWEFYGGTEGVRWGAAAAGWYYTQPVPAGDWTLSAAYAVRSSATTSLVGPVALGSTGAGIGGFLRQGNGYYMASLSAYAFSSYGNGVGDTTVLHDPQRIYITRLQKSGTNWSVTGSLIAAPFKYEPLPSFSSTTSNSTTLDRIGIGVGYTDAGMGGVTLLRFNVT